MKKLALLLALGLLAACGGSDSSTTTLQGNTPQDFANQPAKTITVTITEPQAKVLGMRVGVNSTSSPEMRRIVITNPALDTADRKFQATTPDYIKNATNTVVPFTLPALNGYKIEVLGYKTTINVFKIYTTTNRGPGAAVYTDSNSVKPYTITHYASAKADLKSGSPTINISLADITTDLANLPFTNLSTLKVRDNGGIMRFGIPSQLVTFTNSTSQTYKVTANFNTYSNAFNKKTWGIKRSATSAADLASQPAFEISGTVSGLLTGPYVYTAGTKLYAQAEFYANDNLILRTYDGNGKLISKEDDKLFVFLSKSKNANVLFTSRDVDVPNNE